MDHRPIAASPSALLPLRFDGLHPSLACDIDSFAIGLRPHLLALQRDLIVSLGMRQHEEFWAFLVDRGGYIFAAASIPGDHDSTRVPSRSLLQWAMTREACGLIFAHNHPSGNARPSRADISLTRSWATTCRLLDWTLWDHIIVARDLCYSFREEGLM